MRFAFIVMIVVATIVSGCGQKRIILKECQKVENVDLYIGSPL